MQVRVHLPDYAASPSSDDKWILGSESESNMPPFSRTVFFILLLSAAAFLHTCSSSLSTFLGGNKRKRKRLLVVTSLLTLYFSHDRVQVI